jgi:hypothetical protein
MAGQLLALVPGDRADQFGWQIGAGVAQRSVESTGVSFSSQMEEKAAFGACLIQ